MKLATDICASCERRRDEHGPMSVCRKFVRKAAKDSVILTPDESDRAIWRSLMRAAREMQRKFGFQVDADLR